MRLLSALTALCVLTACSSPRNSAEDACSEVTPQDDTSREDILIVGDSISIGYTPYVTAALPQYEIIHNPCNGRTSVNGLRYLEEWASLRPRFKVITFNHGLWDIVPLYKVSVSAYKDALRQIGTRYLRAADHVIFFLTTYVPPGTENRSDADVLRYNEAAREVMSELGIPVYDLYGRSAQIPLSEHTGPQDVHYTEAGYRDLAAFVTSAIRTELGE